MGQNENIHTGSALQVIVRIQIFICKISASHRENEVQVSKILQTKLVTLPSKLVLFIMFSSTEWHLHLSNCTSQKPTQAISVITKKPSLTPIFIQSLLTDSTHFKLLVSEEAHQQPCHRSLHPLLSTNQLPTQQWD